MQLFIVQSQVDQRGAFATYQILYFGIVIPLVFAAEDKHGFGCHALQGVPAGIDIGCFGIVYELDAAYGRYLFQTVFYTFEVGQGFADIFFADTCKIGGNAGSQ